MTTTIYHSLLQAKKQHQKRFAVLLDPDKVEVSGLDVIIANAKMAKVDYFFVGGSLVVKHTSAAILRYLKENCNIPTIIFPGSTMQVNDEADAIFFLSLISGRNPELLIGQQVMSAPILRQMDIEVLPTGYMLIDGGKPTTVSYISGTNPIPHNKPQIATCTAIAGEMLGLKVIYMDSGSGAERAISTKMISAVSSQIEIPMIIGGGINTPQQAFDICQAGADVVVVGTAIEHNPDLIAEMAKAVHSVQQMA